MNPQLKAKFCTSSISFSDSGLLFNSKQSQPLILVNHPRCTAVIALQGAQLLQFKPVGSQQWLWLSPDNSFAPGTAIHGGIPLCYPWFGRAQSKPIHGYAMNWPWELIATEESEEAVKLTFAWQTCGTDAFFPHETHVRQTLTLGEAIKIDLHIDNSSPDDLDISWAWHTYFRCLQRESAYITGLTHHEYLDNTDALKPCTLEGYQRFNEAVDRVFAGCQQPQVLHTRQQLKVAGHNCPSCIVWNPGPDSEAWKNHYQEFICLERGCAFSDTIHLKSGQDFSASLSITDNNR